MPWKSEQGPETVNCSSPSDTEDGSWVTLGTKELCEYTVRRDDASPSDRWLIDVIRSIDGSRESEPHPRYMLEADELIFTFPVEGTFSFKIRVSNAELTPGDTVQTTHWYRKDGLDL